MQKTKIESFKNILAGVGAVALLVISLVIATDPKNAPENLAALVLRGGISGLKTSPAKGTTGVASAPAGAPGGPSSCGWKTGEWGGYNLKPNQVSFGGANKNLMYVASPGKISVRDINSITTQTNFPEFTYYDSVSKTYKIKKFSNPAGVAPYAEAGEDYVLVSDSGKVYNLVFSTVDINDPTKTVAKYLKLKERAGKAGDEWGATNAPGSTFSPTSILQYSAVDFAVIDKSTNPDRVLNIVTGRPSLQTFIGDKDFSNITDIETNGTYFYVVNGETGKNSISSYTLSGGFYKKYAKQGSEDGEFGLISGMSFVDTSADINDPAKRLYVSDSYNKSMMAFSPTTLDYLFSIKDEGNNKLSNLVDITYGPDGFIYATTADGIVRKIGIQCVTITISKIAEKSDQEFDFTVAGIGTGTSNVQPFKLKVNGPNSKPSSYKIFRLTANPSEDTFQYIFKETPIYKDAEKKIPAYLSSWKCIYHGWSLAREVITGTGGDIPIFGTDSLGDKRLAYYGRKVDCFITNHKLGENNAVVTIIKDVLPTVDNESFIFSVSSSDDVAFKDFGRSLQDDGKINPNVPDRDKYSFGVTGGYTYDIAEKNTGWVSSYSCNYHDRTNKLYKNEKGPVSSFSVKPADYDQVICTVSNCKSNGNPGQVCNAGSLDASIDITKNFVDKFTDVPGVDGTSSLDFKFNLDSGAYPEFNKNFTLKDDGQKDLNTGLAKNFISIPVRGGTPYGISELYDWNTNHKSNQMIISYSCQVTDANGNKVGPPQVGHSIGYDPNDVTLSDKTKAGEGGNKTYVTPPPGGKVSCVFTNCNADPSTDKGGDPASPVDQARCDKLVGIFSQIHIVKDWVTPPGISPQDFVFTISADGNPKVSYFTIDDDGSEVNIQSKKVTYVAGGYPYTITEDKIKGIETTYRCSYYKDGDNTKAPYKTEKANGSQVTVLPKVGDKVICVASNCSVDPDLPKAPGDNCPVPSDTGVTGTGGRGGTGGGEQ